MGDISEKDLDPVSYYIKAIRTSNKHDDVSIELYYAMCQKNDPPYSEWVETWILKCIRECFHETIKADILLASFALLPEYHLIGSTVKSRLWQYIFDSNYLTIYPSKSRRPINEIDNDSEKENIRQKIERMERNYVKELIEQIKDISNPAKHIENLDGYGDKKVQPDGKIVFKPKQEQLKLSYPKQKNNESQLIEITESHLKAQQDEEITSPEGSFGKESSARIVSQQDDQTTGTQQSDNKVHENTTNNDDVFILQHDTSVLKLPVEDNTADSSNDENDSIENYVTKIRFSGHHDDVAEELYKALCGQGEPPYDKWVATWILKCIRKKFKKNTIESDIMNASFALLPGYYLNKDDNKAVRHRLLMYLNDSDYHIRILDPNALPFSAIEDIDERNKVIEAITKEEQDCMEALITYINNISKPKKHIKKLRKYGKPDPQGKVYTPKKTKIFLKKGSISRNRHVRNISAAVAVVACIILTSSVAYFSNIKNPSPTTENFSAKIKDPLEPDGKPVREPCQNSERITSKYTYSNSLLCHILDYIEKNL